MSSMSQKVNDLVKEVDETTRTQVVDPAVGLGVIKVLNALGYELRIFIDVSNGGGHQTTTTNIVKRMIDHGFRAPIRIFYDTESTLEMFFDGYQPGAEEMDYRGVTLLFHPPESKAPSTKAPLLICGGSEAKEGGLEERLSETNCCFYLQLQPWLWKSDDYLLHAKLANPSDPISCNPQAGIETIVLNGEEALGKAQFAHSAYAQPTPTRDPDVWNRYAALKRFQKVVPMAEKLADFSPQAWTMPSYGLVSWKFALNLVLALAQAQPKLEPKPIVLYSFGSLLEPASDYDEDEPSGGLMLEQILAATSNFLDDYPLLKAHIVEKELPRRCVVYRKKDPVELEEKLRDLPGDGILIVSMGSTPNEVFNYLYAQATLPLVFEGRGTLNLAFNLGKPYLCPTHSAGGAYPGPAFTANPPAEGVRAQRLSGLIESSPYKYKQAETEESPWPAMELADGIVELLTSEAMQGYFAGLPRVFGDLANDRLLKALRFCADLRGFPH